MMKLVMLLTFTALAECDDQRRGAHLCPDLCSCGFSPSVSEVVCSHSSLKHFPVAGLPPNITRLSIQSTNLSSITSSHLRAVPLLNYLQLYYTNLANLPSELLGVLPHLDTLDLTGNQLIELPSNFFSYASLRCLIMKSNQFGKAEAAWFPDNSSLTRLDFSANHLTSFPAALLQKLPHLHNLDLSDNNLQELQADIFKNLHHLETLNLAGNKLISLQPTTFAHNLKLKQLFLQENQLKELPATLLQSLLHLELLLLNQNKLQHLPTGLLDGRKPSFRMILTGNPWECDVKMEYLWKWLNVNPQSVLFLEEVTCVSPETLKHHQVASLNERQLGLNSE